MSRARGAYNRDRILDWLASRERYAYFSVREIALGVGLSESCVRRHIDQMTDEEVVPFPGDGPAHYRRARKEMR